MINSYEGAVTLASVAVPTVRYLGAALTLAISGALWQAVGPASYTRVTTWAVRALRGALRLAVAILGLPVRTVVNLGRTYLHWGWRGQAHTYVKAGRHRPEYVARHPWTPVKAWKAA